MYIIILRIIIIDNAYNKDFRVLKYEIVPNPYLSKSESKSFFLHPKHPISTHLLYFCIIPLFIILGCRISASKTNF